MKILLFGANGQVGWEIRRSLKTIGELVCCGRNEANLEDLDLLRSFIREQKPDIIVNAAAYTAVDKAETEKDLAYRINAEAVEVMAQEAKKLDALLVHYSTDYIFDGVETRPITETDATNPLNAYGMSKLEGERVIQNSGCRHLIFRTSWVHAKRGQNFIKTILRLAQEREELKIVADQTGTPTSAELIADVTAIFLERISQLTVNNDNVYGIYNLSASGETTWHQFANTLVSQAQSQGLKIKTNSIHPITTDEYPLPAKRPAHVILDTTKLCSLLSITLPRWEVEVQRSVVGMLKEN